MKKLIFLLLIPIISFGQTYEDIVSIDSKEQFIRIGIENNYEINFNKDERVKMILQPSYDGDKAVKGRAKAEFINNDEGLAAIFSFNQDSVQEKSKYDEIFSVVKRNHKFKEILGGNYNGEAASVYILDEKTDVAFFIEDGWCVVAILARNSSGEINPLVGTWEGDMNDASGDSVYGIVVLKSDNTGSLKIPTSENTYELELFNWSSTSTALKLSYIDDFNEVYNTEFIDYEFYDNNTLKSTDNQGVISFFYRSE